MARRGIFTRPFWKAFLVSTVRIAALAAALLLTAGGVRAQGHGPKKYAATSDRALIVTREVLGHQGFEVVRVVDQDNDRIIWYRRGNMGRGKGKGPLQKMIIRRVPAEHRILFVDVPEAILVDIDVRLRLP